MDVAEDDLPALLDRVAETVGSRMDELFGLVEIVHRRVSDILDEFAERHRTPDRAALAAVRPLLHELLAADEPLLEGFDMAFGSDTLSDTTRWLECWRHDADGNSYFVKHILNPESVGFYDYQSHDWFTAPIAAGHAVTTGPYIDVGGIDVCTITLGIPLKAASGGTAVIGADLSIPGLEALLLRTLRTRRHEVVLLAANERVVVSNSARHVTGSRLRLADSERVEHSVPVRSQDPQRLPWRVVGLS
ncbi:cache domain-containing protein [Mycolicibacterium sp.]|uniref:cache domain-containing protein n=1 Tax=Mycolicibacterium sp. TaxID=2320850 RepID=UPI0037C88BC4